MAYPGVSASYRAQHHSIPVAVRVTIQHDTVLVEGPGVRRSAPLATIDADLQYEGLPSTIRFPDGASCEIADGHALANAFAANHGRGRSQWQGSMPRSFYIALLLFVLALVALYHYGVPWIARVAAAGVPVSVTKPLDEATLAMLDAGSFTPSTLAEARQQALKKQFASVVGTEAIARYRVLFRSSREGDPNAMALPAGTIVVTDELVNLARSDAEILGVMAHEAGHVEHRHSVRMIMQDSAVSLIVAAVVGDASSLLADAPAALLSAKYSRDFEREADTYAADVLLRNGLRPGVIADILERMDPVAATVDEGQPVRTGEPSLLDYASTHPSTTERLDYLRSRDPRP